MIRAGTAARAPQAACLRDYFAGKYCNGSTGLPL